MSEMSFDPIHRDDAGKPIEYDQHLVRVEREAHERECARRLHLERGDGDVTVVDGIGHPVLRLIGLPSGVADAEDERWLIARAERLLSIEKPDLRLVS